MTALEEHVTQVLAVIVILGPVALAKIVQVYAGNK
jgi:hypothetical protein